jgi:hypothetical protein
MGAVIFKIEFPEGISVLGNKMLESYRLSLGTFQKEFMMSFECKNGPKLLLVKFVCKANEDFSGGVVQLGKGDYEGFIGYSMCDQERTRIPAKAGGAVLTLK